MSVHGAHLVNAPWIAPGGLLLEALPYGNWGEGHHARFPSRNTDLEYLRVCGLRPSRSLPKNEQLCERRTPAARKCALVARATARDAAPAPESTSARRRSRASALTCWRSG